MVVATENWKQDECLSIGDGWKNRFTYSMNYYVSMKMTALGSNPGTFGASHGVSFNEKNTMKKVCMMDCFWKTSNDPWRVCVCVCVCAAIQVSYLVGG